MRLVVDANILFAALIKNSRTADLLFNENLRLCAPLALIEEFLNYGGLILEKTSRSREEFIQTVHLLKEVLEIIPESVYFGFIKEAKTISPDRGDALYFALALSLKCGIWSNEKVLKTQDRVRVYSTKDLLDTLKIS